MRGGLAVDGNLAGAVEEEALRDEVGVVVDEGLLDELVKRVEREAERRLRTGEFGEIAGDLAADAGEPGAVGIVEDILLPAGEADIGQGLAERVGNLGEHEALLAVRAEQDDGGNLDGFGGDDIAPSVVGLLINRSVDGALEGQIVRQGGIAHGTGKM